MTPITYEFKPGERYPVIMVCADAAVFHKDPVRGLCLVAIVRKDNNKFALPGGFVEYSESSLTAAVRELKEETGLNIKYLEEVSFNRGYLHFDDPLRTKIGNRKITTTHIFEVSKAEKLTAGDDAKHAIWMKVEDFINQPDEFVHDDHKQIVLNCKRLL